MICEAIQVKRMKGTGAIVYRVVKETTDAEGVHVRPLSVFAESPEAARRVIWQPKLKSLCPECKTRMMKSGSQTCGFCAIYEGNRSRDLNAGGRKTECVCERCGVQVGKRDDGHFWLCMECSRIHFAPPKQYVPISHRPRTRREQHSLGFENAAKAYEEMYD